MKYFCFFTILVLTLATLGSAQLPDFGFSEECKNGLLKLVGDKELNSCIPFASFASIGASKDKVDQDTLVKTADTICGEKKCPDDLINRVQNDIKTACQKDLVDKKSPVNYILIALSLYSPTRDSICFKNSTDGYCFIESKIATDQILQNTPKDQDPTITFAGAPKEVVCTPCNKAIFNTYFNYLNEHPEILENIKQAASTSVNIEDIKNALKGKCGQNFIDGKVGDSKQNPSEFQTQGSKSSDATSLVLNHISLLALAGSILVTL